MSKSDHRSQTNLTPPSCRTLCGQALLNAVKEQNHPAAINGFQHATTIVQQSGLLHGNLEIARRILLLNSRGRRRGGSSENTCKFKKDKATTTTVVSNLEAQYALTATVNVLSSSSSMESHPVHPWAAAFVTALCQHLQAAPTADDVFLAEFELLSNMGKPLLLQLLQPFSKQAQQAAGALVRLLNTRLSRSPNILDSIRIKCWESLVPLPSEQQQQQEEAATIRLLATLPLTGYQDQSPAQVWNATLSNTIASLQLVMEAVAPIHTIHPSTTSMTVDESTTRQVQGWLERIRQDGNGSQPFVRLVTSLVHLIVALLERDSATTGGAMAVQQQHLFLSCVVPTTILEISERLLSFSSQAEVVFYQTKKRLRSNPVENGILSVKSIVQVANDIRSLGHLLLDSIVSCCGVALLPFARRLRKAALTALQSACSSKLRAALDPAVSVNVNQPGFLQCSICLRSAAVRSLGTVIASFGCDPQRNKRGQRRTSLSSANDVDRSVAWVCGNAIEQVSGGADKDDWGTLGDRLDLLVASLDCLTVFLESGGRYLSLEMRGLVDSTASFCLELAQKRGVLHLLSSNRVKMAFLNLGRACVCVPWQDGATASRHFGNLLQNVAKLYQKQGQAGLLKLSSSTLAICASLDCPRVPALNVIKRSETAKFSSGLCTADEMLRGMEVAQRNMDKANEVHASTEADQEAEGPQRKVARRSESHTEIQSPLVSVDTSSACKVEVPSTDEPSLPVPVNADVISAHAKPQGNAELVDNSKSKPQSVQHLRTKDESDNDDMEFPEIVDCGPDDDDK